MTEPAPPAGPRRPERLEAAPLGAGGPAVSPLGFGGYRVDDETPVHRAALDRALEAGCTLVDTSTNYTDGGSESLVGAALDDLARRSPERRRRVVVVSKIGYVQGSNLALALEREREGRPFPDMVKYMDGCWHCIHPDFLADQLARSRRRLGVATLDVCLLHNPEYFLSDAAHRGLDRDRARAEFDGRLRAAFAFLEERVRQGEIGAYGVSSNTAVSPAGDAEATSVRRMLDAAEAGAGPGHRFRVLQVPMNLFESGAALERNTGDAAGRTALEEASAKGLGVLVNRPLNAILGRHLVRLSDASRAAAAVRQALEPHLPAERRGESLSRLALWIAASTPGVSCVLVGMRQPAYVEDALGIVGWERHADPLAAYGAIARLAES